MFACTFGWVVDVAFCVCGRNVVVCDAASDAAAAAAATRVVYYSCCRSVLYIRYIFVVAVYCEFYIFQIVTFVFVYEYLCECDF